MDKPQYPKPNKTPKTSIKLRTFKIEPMENHHIIRWRKDLWKHLDCTLKIPLSSIRVNCTDISNQQRLARVIRNNYGLGTFLILFFNYKCPSKKYKQGFICQPTTCPYKQDNRCHISDRWKRGWACKANPRHRPNWSPRAKIVIYPNQAVINQYGEDNSIHPDYHYKYLWSKMHYFRKWFWQD